MKRYFVASLLLLVGAAGCTVPSPFGGGSTIVTTESPYIASVLVPCGPTGCVGTLVSSEDTVTICSLQGGPMTVTPLDGLSLDSAKITTKNGTPLLDQSIDAGSSATGVRDLGPGECVRVVLQNFFSNQLKARVDF